VILDPIKKKDSLNIFKVEKKELFSIPENLLKKLIPHKKDKAHNNYL
jgi:hypothetical protein